MADFSSHTLEWLREVVDKSIDKSRAMLWDDLTPEQRQEIIDAVSKEIPTESEPQSITEEDIKALLDKV